MANMHKVGKHATTVQAGVNGGFVKYHNTVVVEWTKQNGHTVVTLRNGGYLTNTTKTRINQASYEYGLGFSVFQENFNWYVAIGAQSRNGIVRHNFVDGMQIDTTTGEVLNAGV